MSSSIDADLVSLNSSLTRLTRRIRRIDEAQGVGRARLSALAVIHFGGPCSMSDLAQTEMVSRATMHHIVNGMERADLVRRNIDPDDARRQILSLTAKGRATIRAAHRERIAYLKRLSGGVSGADLATTARTLCRLRGNAGAQSA